MKYKPVGWRHESHRHYLAAKGIRTNRYKAIKPTKDERDNYGAWVDNPDNPGWLKGEIEKGPRASTTAGTDVVWFDVDKAMKIPGAEREHTKMDSKDSKFRIKKIADSIRKDGFDAETDPPMIVVTRDDGAIVWEGNHRIRAAKEVGLKKVPVEIRWFNAAEEESPDTYEDVIRDGKYFAKKLEVDGGKYALVEDGDEKAHLIETRRIGTGVHVAGWNSEEKGAGRELLKKYVDRDDAPTVIAGEWTPKGLTAARDVLLEEGYEEKTFGKRAPNMRQAIFHKGKLPKLWGGE